MEIFDWVKVGIGAVACIAGIYLVIKGIVDRVRAIKLQGTIVDYVRESNNYYYPLVEFEYEGQRIRMSTSEGSNAPKNNIGKEIKILYSPNNGKYVMVSGQIGDILIGVVVAIAAGAFAVAQLM